MSNLQPHQQRVVDERTELDDKIAKLSAFAKTDFFLTIGLAERLRLSEQICLMREYSRVLGERITAFGAAGV